MYSMSSKILSISGASDENLKPVKDEDGVVFPLELATDKVRLSRDLSISGDVDIQGTISSRTVYTGEIIGYTALQGDGTNFSSFEIQNSITVEDSTHKISFVTPPSETVEIEAICAINIGSTDTRITVGLSDSDTYNSIGGTFEYDNLGIVFTDDEVDDHVISVKWVLTASELVGINRLNNFWIGFGTAGATKTAYLAYGFRSATGLGTHPFIIKATALPAVIYDGQ